MVKDKQYLMEALTIAEQAKARGDTPIGAILVLPNKILIESDTTYTESKLNHAEIHLLKKAEDLGYRNLRNGIIYSTIEPCAYCACAIAQFGIREVVFGVYDPKKGFTRTLREAPFTYRGGVLEKEMQHLLYEYYG